MKTNRIHTSSLKGFTNPVSGQYWALINDEYEHIRGIINT